VTGPPTGLRIDGAYIEPIKEIQAALSRLGQRKTLELARSAFPFRFGSAILRWERRGGQFGLKRFNEDKCKVLPDSINYHFQDCLTLADTKFLAGFEYLDPNAIEQSFMGEARIALPSAASPVELGTGTEVVEFGLLVSVIYFWLYQHEARFSATFPTPGTLFSTFRRAWGPRALFLLFLSVPASSGVLLAFWSFESVKAGNRSLAILVLAFCVLIAAEAHQARRRPPVAAG
jgi:hypothetical protein